MDTLTPYSELPSLIQDSMQIGAELARNHAIVRGQNPATVDSNKIRCWSVLCGMVGVDGLDLRMQDLRAAANTPRPPNEIKDGQYVHRGLAPALQVADFFAARRKAAADAIKQHHDAMISATVGTQIVKGTEEPQQVLPWRELAPPTVSPEWGASTMEIPKLKRFGTSGVHGSLDGPFQQVKAGAEYSTAQVGYILVETYTDPLLEAQAARGAINLRQILDMNAELSQEHRLGMIAMFGDSAYNWSSALGTITDKTTVKVDGTVALLVEALQVMHDAYRDGMGSVLDAFRPNFGMLSDKIAQRLTRPYDSSEPAVLGIDVLQRTTPGVKWVVSSSLDNHPSHSGNSIACIGHRGPSRGSNAVIYGPQMLADNADTIFIYQDGLKRKALRLRSCAGAFNPHSELIVAHRFDTVT